MLMIELFLTARFESCVPGASYFVLQATRGKHAKGRGGLLSFSPLARSRKKKPCRLGGGGGGGGG